MVDKPRFCKDCKWYLNQNCEHPSNMDYDLVTGEGVSRQTPATLRKYSEMTNITVSCGPEASWFEPKEPTFVDAMVDIAIDAYNNMPPQRARDNPRQPRYAVNPDQFAPPPDEGEDPRNKPRLLMM